MTEETKEFSYERVMNTLEDIQKRLDGLNAAPNVKPVSPKGVEDQSISVGRSIMDRSDMVRMRTELRKLTTPELWAMFQAQAARRDTGIPFDVWANRGGMSLQNAIGSEQVLTKALDSSGASALIRQDLEPLLYEVYVREFPAWERFPKEPANGLVHAYNQITAYGDAQFMTELGTVTDDKSTYVRKTANVAVIATRRGISLRSQFAVQAGGMSWSPEALELQGGIRAIAHKMQKTIFQGNASQSGGTAADEYGLYDANAFDGLRYILSDTNTSATRVKAADLTATTPDDIRTAIDRAATEIMNYGGKAGIIWSSPSNKVSFDLQQDKNVRYMNQFVDVAPGVQTNAVNTVFGPLPIAMVPGDAITQYTGQSVPFPGGSTSHLVDDLYLLDEQTISMPYLGSEGPTTLDIPIGISGQLTHLYIIFGMWGMAVKVLPFSNKVQIGVPS